MTTDLNVDNAASFRRVVVERDYADYKSDPLDVRRAYHLALSLFHLSDWTFQEFGQLGNWKFGRDTSVYQGQLEAGCREFGYIRDVANAVKHCVLERKTRTQMTGAKDVVVAGAAFDPGAFEASAFQTKSTIVVRIAPNQAVNFEYVADKVKAMWDTLFEREGWT